MSERTLQEQTITRGSHFRNVLNCRYSNQLHTHCGYEAQILFPANPTSRRFLRIDLNQELNRRKQGCLRRITPGP